MKVARTSPLQSVAVQSSCPICGVATTFRHYLSWDGCEWVRCPLCEGGHREPYVPELEDEELRTSNYDDQYFDADFFGRRWRFAAGQAMWLARHYRAGMTVLEVGPGLGLAARRFHELAPGAPYHVIEPHQTFAGYIDKEQGAAVVVHSGDPEEALTSAIVELRARGPILFYMDNVLEHVAHPCTYVRRLKESLPPGSVALFDVPNEFGLKTRCRVYKALGATPTAAPAHINLFTGPSLHTMLRGLGLYHRIRQRGIRTPEEVNCLPTGPPLYAVLALLRVMPIDTILGLGNNLRVEVRF